MPKYKKINKNNLLQNIVLLQVKKYIKHLEEEFENEKILNEKEMEKFKRELEISINLNIYNDLNKLEFQ